MNCPNCQVEFTVVVVTERGLWISYSPIIWYGLCAECQETWYWVSISSQSRRYEHYQRLDAFVYRVHGFGGIIHHISPTHCRELLDVIQRLKRDSATAMESIIRSVTGGNG